MKGKNILEKALDDLIAELRRNKIYIDKIEMIDGFEYQEQDRLRYSAPIFSVNENIKKSYRRLLDEKFYLFLKGYEK